MRLPRNAAIFRGQLDVAPFAGVFFLLLIFLILSSSLVFHPGVPLSLPTAGGAASPADERRPARIRLPEFGGFPGTRDSVVVVAMDQAGKLYYRNQVVAPLELESRLRSDIASMKQPVTLVVQADKRVPYERVVALANVARKAGIENAILSTRPPRVPLPQPPEVE